MDGENRVAGLDERGLPDFYTVGGDVESSLEGGYRLTRGDIERGTLLIPDISMIRKGDLLVRYDVSGEPHIGIVAGLGWSSSNGPEWGAEASAWWSTVYVVSVRRGYRTVSLSSWGNTETVFGGFTDSPEAYQIRRILVKRDEAAQLQAAPPAWELVDEVAVKLRTDYPPENNVPRVYQRIRLSTLKEGNTHYYRELPSTSIQQKATTPLFGQNAVMRLPCFTGWRTSGTDDDNDGTVHQCVSYHRGIDIKPDIDGLAENTSDFYAPEDGLFWIFRSPELKVPEHISLPSRLSLESNDNEILIDRYRSDVYGFIGILLTRPDAPKEGRIYLFAHMGEQFTDIDPDTSEVPETVQNDSKKLSYFSEYEVRTVAKKYPQGPENAIPVCAGEWIGKVGNRGKSSEAAHIHLEVYEYFQDAADQKWQRVEPLSVFDERLFTIRYMDGNNHPQVKNTYGWWSRAKGNTTAFATEAAELNGLQTGDGADSLFYTWYNVALDNWISVKNYGDFPDSAGSSEKNRFENVFLPDAWERKKQPGYSEE
jgi:hypothetical protein